MTGKFLGLLGNRLQLQCRKRTGKKSAARRETSRTLGWEQLEGRVLLTAAATITWTGGSTTSSNWNDPANWDLKRAPINGDSLVFPASAQRLANNDDIPGLSVNSITFQGAFATSSGYTLSGDDLVLGAGGIVDNINSVDGTTTVANQIDLNVTLAAAQNWSVSELLTINGNLANGGFTPTATGPGMLDFAGQISGSGGLAVAATQGIAPTVELLNSNAYTGLTSVEQGTLIVDGSTAAASTVFVSSGGTLGGTGTVGGQVTVFGAGDTPTGSFPAGTLDPGRGPNLSEGTGTLFNSGGVLFEQAFIAYPASGDSPQTSGNATGAAQFNVQLGGTAANPTNDQLDSTGTVALSPATLNLSTLASAGPFNAGQQFVIVQAGAAITTTFEGLPEGSTLSDGTQNFTISYANNRVTLTALATGTLTWTGNSTTGDKWSDPANWNLNRAPINGDSLVFPVTAKQLANNDDIPGLVVNSITFQGTTVTGGYTLSGDDLTVGAGGIADNARIGLPPSVIPSLLNQIDLNVALSAGETWSISDPVSMYHRLIVNGNVDNGGFLLTATGEGTLDFTGQISGGGGLRIDGDSAEAAPTVELQNANTYTGATSVGYGTLIVNGSTADASTVFLDGGATLGGTGTIGGQITFVVGGVVGLSVPGATLDPGSDSNLAEETGALSNTGGVSFEMVPASSDTSLNPQFAMQLGGTAANPTNDQFKSAGTVSLDGATLDLTALAGAGPFNPGQQFVLVQAGAPITTTFANLLEGSTVSDGTQNFTISYANDRVTLTAQPPTATTSTYLNGQAGDGTAATFVQNLYRELLGREPDAPGQTFWVNFFTQASGNGGSAAAQRTLIDDFLASTEYHQHLVEGMYTDLLHRAADAGGLAFWTAAMAGGLDEKNVLTGLLASNEYLGDSFGPGAHSDNDMADALSWVTALYDDVLGRSPDAGGLAYWTQQTTDNLLSRAGVAFAFLSTPEANQKLLNANYPGAAGSVGAPGTSAVGAYALADITGSGWDNLYFQGNLSTAEVDTLFAQLQAGQSYGETIAGMLEMSQYFG